MKYYDEPETCFRCGAVGEMAHHHLIPGNPGRKLSDQYGLVVPLCPRCHEFVHSGKPTASKVLNQMRRYGQMIAMQEQGWTEDDFRRVFGKSYL